MIEISLSLMTLIIIAAGLGGMLGLSLLAGFITNNRGPINHW